jgi:hypothetical protein
MELTTWKGEGMTVEAMWNIVSCLPISLASLLRCFPCALPFGAFDCNSTSATTALKTKALDLDLPPRER